MNITSFSFAYAQDNSLKPSKPVPDINTGGERWWQQWFMHCAVSWDIRVQFSATTKIRGERMTSAISHGFASSTDPH